MASSALSTPVSYVCQRYDIDPQQLIPFMRLFLAAWCAIWFMSFLFSSSVPFFSDQLQMTDKQLKLLGLTTTKRAMKFDERENKIDNNNKITINNTIVTDPYHTHATHDTKLGNGAVNKELATRADQHTRRHLESQKPSAYSNFLLSAVTSSGCHNRSPNPCDSRPSLSAEISSSSPYLVPGYHSQGYRDQQGRYHASPHLHNHASRGFRSPYRDGENYACITAARTDYISPQKDISNFRQRRGRRSASSSPLSSPHPGIKQLLSPPPTLPINPAFANMNAASGSAVSNVTALPRASSPATRKSSSTPGQLAPPDPQQCYDPVPNMASERMQFLIENRDYYESLSDLKSPQTHNSLMHASIAVHSNKPRTSLRLTMARNDIVTSPIFQYFNLSEEPGGAMDLERYISNLRIALSLRLQEHLKNFDYYVGQIVKVLKLNGLVQSDHHSEAVINILKMKKHDRLDIQNSHIDSAEELVRYLDGLQGIAQSYTGELDSVVQSYVILLSLFTQPLESRLSAKKTLRRRAQTTDSLGRERERDRDWEWDQDGEHLGREKVLAADVLRLCRQHSYDVRCIIDRYIQLSKDSHLGKFSWDANFSVTSKSPRSFARSGGKGKDFNIADSELIIALFFHHCDARRSEQDLRHYSRAHYLVDLILDDDIGNKHAGLVTMQSPQKSPSQHQAHHHHHHHHKVGSGGKSQRQIDFMGYHSDEPSVLLTMRTTEPSHFNIYLLNYKRNRHKEVYAHSSAGSIVNDTEDPSSSQPNSPPQTHSKGGFDFLKSGFQGLPKSVATMEKQEESRVVKFPYSGNNSTSTKKHKHLVEELFVPEGRQNVFLVILFYLITSQALAGANSSGRDDGNTKTLRNSGAGGQLEGALRDIAVEVFGSAKVPGHLHLP